MIRSILLLLLRSILVIIILTDQAKPKTADVGMSRHAAFATLVANTTSAK